jgi:cytochrome c556
MRQFAVIVSIIVISATAVYGQNLDVIKQRRETMRAISGASGPIWKMYTGKAPFELAKVQSALKTMQEQFGKFRDQFPEDSKKGGETDAKSLIWSDRAGFNGAIDATIAALKKASSAIKDEASFKPGYKPVAESCGGCHKVDNGYTIRLGDSFKKPEP